MPVTTPGTLHGKTGRGRDHVRTGSGSPQHVTRAKELHQSTTSSNATHHHTCRRAGGAGKHREGEMNRKIRSPPVRLHTHSSRGEEGSVLKDLVAFDVYAGNEDPFQIGNQVLHRMVPEIRFLFKASLHDTVVGERRMIFPRWSRRAV